MEIKKRILVIGAGVSGLTAIKACREENLDVVCYEKSEDYGGLWRYHDWKKEGLASVFKNTVSNSSKEMSAFSDFPPTKEFPTYLHHTYVLKYLEEYAKHFDLLSSIRYSLEVSEVVQAEDYERTGRWLVKVRNLCSNTIFEEVFDGIMTCIGHHAYPYTPLYPKQDSFSGKLLHSCSYRSPDGMENKTVLVVGAGNSGADIAVEVSNTAEKVYLSTRRGAWIYPRCFKRGKPLDVSLARRYKMFLPSNYIEKKLEKDLNNLMDHKRYGIQPVHRVLKVHPTINDEIQAKILTGAVKIKKDIQEFVTNGVIFNDDKERTPVDVVIFATGFEAKFPFLNKDILKVGRNDKIVLYKNVFPPQIDQHTLAIIGLVQPTGSLFPVFELQSRWFVALMTGKCSLPSSKKMLADTCSTDGMRLQLFVQSQRHAYEELWMVYMDKVASYFGAKPNMCSLLFKDPKLFKACLFGPLLPYQYRLTGPHDWKGAREAILNYKKRIYGHLDNS